MQSQVGDALPSRKLNVVRATPLFDDLSDCCGLH